MPSQDTGGLGLLQMLAQAGIPPQVLLQFLMSPQTLGLLPLLGNPTPDPSNEQPDPTANNDPEGTPGNAPGTGGAAVSGMMGGGLIGQLANDLGVPSSLQGPAATAVTTALGATGVPALPITLANRLFGAAKRAAEHNLRQAGRRVAPIEFNGPRTIPDTPPPNSTFNDPANLGDVGGTSGTPGTAAATGSPSPTADLGLTVGLAPPSNVSQGPIPNVPESFTQTEAAIVAAIDAAANALGEPSGGPGGPAGSSGGVGQGDSAGDT